MFESSFVTEPPRAARAWSLSTAAAVQVLMAGTALLVPLLFIPALPGVVWRRPAVPAAPMELVETPPEFRSLAQPAAGGHGFPFRRASARLFTQPRGIPSQIAMLLDEPTLDAGYGPSNATGLPVQSGIPGVLTGNPIQMAPPVARPVVAGKPQPPPEQRVYRVGGRVQSPLLLHEVRPLYPTLARQARIAGTVRLEAVIAKDGLIQSLRLLSGHPLLAPAALDAVRQWRYRAATLNGQPVDVALSIEVTFTLSN
ncbi:MAG: energy transducer TonB [Acidobacteriia bacterium]|nr:energy transducer TonB [Terriglobia bacterium]